MIKVTESESSISLVYVSKTGNVLRLRRFNEADSVKMRGMLKEIGAVGGVFDDSFLEVVAYLSTISVKDPEIRRLVVERAKNEMTRHRIESSHTALSMDGAEIR
ncbi:hypothetical protein DMB44_05340 [Thermoplasma sp. Kam2015]|uniref:hypothetical protein n=1 Tax=Thermoplasma sp. Kam2015 TaxID=2094122 RepID=UPI000D955432|nr:hypothetical protein [Thermoplasma sp. Kam2015]PYB68145.1 hypothetical protein DMB44_05340 [Thermoplasma sp. Kam2015]